MPQPRFRALLQLALLAALLLAAAAQDPQLLPVQSNETGEGLRRDSEGRLPTSLLFGPPPPLPPLPPATLAHAPPCPGTAIMRSMLQLKQAWLPYCSACTAPCAGQSAAAPAGPHV